MRRFSLLSLLAVAVTSLGFANQTVVVTSAGAVGGAGTYSDGTPWPTTGGVSFDIGVFPAGFDPATMDPSAWPAAWTSLRRNSATGTVASWVRDGSSAYFSIVGASSLLPAGGSSGSQYYVWGYTTRATGAEAEWILLTNPAWRVTSSATPMLPESFEIADSGTVAVAGQIFSGGALMRSQKVFPGVMAFTSQIAAYNVASGQPATISVTVRGSGLSFQWYAGNSGDTSQPVAGATRASYTLGAVAATSRYWVRVTNGTETIDSNTITVNAAAAASIVTGTHESGTQGYVAGQRVRIHQTVSYTGTLNRLDIAVLLPAGWTYLSSDEPAAASKPTSGNRDLLEWSWTAMPESPFSFDYVALVPREQTGEQLVTAVATAIRDGAAYQALLQPEPIRVGAGPLWHSADINHNNRIDLTDLLRVIEIYNTRNGTVRTGAYRLDATTEDGIAADPARAASAVAALATYHTADCLPRDGHISLQELLRVIELYNYRSGTVRTGAYFARGDTEDGFVPGIAPP